MTLPTENRKRIFGSSAPSDWNQNHLKLDESLQVFKSKIKDMAADPARGRFELLRDFSPSSCVLLTASFSTLSEKGFWSHGDQPGGLKVQ